MSDPQRRLRLTLDLGADDLKSAATALEHIAHDLLREGRETVRRTSGGWDSGFHLEVRVTDPEMTGDRYREGLSQGFIGQRKPGE